MRGSSRESALPVNGPVGARFSGRAGLRVTSRYAALRFRARGPVDPQRVGRDLGVRYVLQGSLRHIGDRVRVAVEVTEAATGYNAWAQTYDQSLRDVFAVQDSVAVRVAEAVRGRPTRAERARWAAAPPTTSNG